VSYEFIPPIVKLAELDAVVSVDDGDAILMVQALASRLGLAVGISSGAHFLRALQVQDRVGPKAVVVPVSPDDNKKYLSTDLIKAEAVKGDALSPSVALLGFDVLGRSCLTCLETSPRAARASRAEAGRCVLPGRCHAQDGLRREPAHGRARRHAVAAEAGAPDEVLDLRIGAQNEAAVRREGAQSSPSVRERRLGQRRQEA